MSHELPSGWLGITLGDKCKFTQGVQISSQNMIRESSNGYMRYMYIRDFLSDDRKWFVEDIYPEKVITELDIAMANTGHTSGTVYKGKLGVLSNNAFKISFSPEEINTDYIFNFLKGDFFLRKIQQLFNTAGQPHVGHGNIAKMPMLLPPLPEQQKIAKILTSVDEVIEKTQAQIDKLKDLKTGMMQELLTSGVKSNGIGHTEFKDSPVGRIPAEWEALALNQVAKLSRGRFSHRPRNDPSFYNGQYPFLQTGDIPKESPYITGFSQSLNDKGLGVSKIFPIGTLVITIAATIGEIGILQFDSCFPDSLVGIDVKSDVAEPMFVLYVMRYFKDELEALAPQTAQKNINLDILSPFKIPVPPISEQKLIANSLESVDSNIEKHRKKLVTLQNTKKALMQDLLTGKIRVKVDN